MRKIKLEKINAHLREELKNKQFREAYEIERVKVGLAQKIAQIREEENLRQVDLAKRLGVSQQFVSQIETGQEKNLTLETLIKIAKSLGRGVKVSFPKVRAQDSCLRVA